MILKGYVLLVPWFFLLFGPFCPPYCPLENIYTKPTCTGHSDGAYFLKRTTFIWMESLKVFVQGIYLTLTGSSPWMLSRMR